MNVKICNKFTLNKKNITNLFQERKIIQLQNLFNNQAKEDSTSKLSNNIDINANFIYKCNNAKASFKLENNASSIRVIFCNAFNITYEQYILIAHEIALDVYLLKLYLKQWKIFFKGLIKLLNDVPLAYILGYQDFYEHKFLVNKHVLIPRGDSEVLIEAVLQDINYAKDINIFEFGVGSGCLIISILDAINIKNCKIKAQGLGIDISKRALQVAQKNKEAIKINNLILLEYNWNKQLNCNNLIKKTIAQHEQIELKNMLEEKFDIIIANPPYISTKEAQYMSNSTLLYEPKRALFAKQNGLKDYIAILQKHRNLMHEESVLYFELGFLSLAGFLEIIAKDNFFIVDKIYKDLQGIERVIKLCIKRTDI